MKKVFEKYISIIIPYLIALVTAIVGWLWNFHQWRGQTDLKIKDNYCKIIKQSLADKKEDLNYKQSSITANIYSKLGKQDSLEYYRRTERESIRLNGEIKELERQQERNGC